MKMVIAIVKDTDAEKVSQALLAAGFRVTQLATTGGFLRGGATTLMTGVENEEVEQALRVIREQFTPSQENDDKQATLYVLNVKDFKRV
jgi:uncharacterized protein YaaQ